MSARLLSWGVFFLTADSEHVIIPRTENTIKCKEVWMPAFSHMVTNAPADINSELDELDREEFYRLKKVRRG